MVTRIIAGQYASRRLLTPSTPKTRPTTDRVRESVFARIASWRGTADREASEQLQLVRFLDLYAGSGAVGLEALSRGAEVTWVESDRVTAGVIRANLASLSASGQVVVSDVGRYLARPHPQTGFDIVWMDPPYAVSNQEVGAVLGLLARPGWVSSSGLVIVERPSHTSAVEFPQCFLSINRRDMGGTVIYYAEKESQ